MAPKNPPVDKNAIPAFLTNKYLLIFFILFVIFCALVYIIYFLIKKISRPELPEALKNGTNENLAKMVEYYIDPPPNPDRATPFPSLFNQSNEILDISILVMNDEMSGDLIEVLKEIINVLSCPDVADQILRINANKTKVLTYEIIILDNYPSHMKPEIFDFALANPEVKILHLKEHYSLYTAFKVGLYHTQGRLIFSYLHSEGVKFNEISKYLEKMEIEKRKNEFIAVFGKWKQREDEESVFKTNLSIFLDFLFDYFQSFWNLKENEYHRCFTYLINRPCAKIVHLNTKLFDIPNDIEIISLAQSGYLAVKVTDVDAYDDAVLSKTSTQKLDELSSLLSCQLMYGTGFWKVKIPKRRT